MHDRNDAFGGDAVAEAAAAVADSLPSGRGPTKRPKHTPVRPTAERLAQMRPMGDVELDEDGGIRRVEFTVPGRPLTWQRARRGKTGPYFTPEDRLSKMAEVRDAWYSLGLPPFDRKTYLRLGVTAYCIRPNTHFRASGELKPWALREFPGAGKNGGDIDNFVKLPMDALSQVAFADDIQVIGFLAATEKRYVEPDKMARTVIAIEPVQSVDLAEVDGEDRLIAQQLF